MAFEKTGYFVGLNHGFIVTKPKVANDEFRKEKSHRKGRLHPRVKAVREVIAEVAGLNPFERKMIEMIKTGTPAKEKRARKLARAKLGGHHRALRKRDQMIAVVQAQKKKWWTTDAL